MATQQALPLSAFDFSSVIASAIRPLMLGVGYIAVAAIQPGIACITPLMAALGLWAGVVYAKRAHLRGSRPDVAGLAASGALAGVGPAVAALVGGFRMSGSNDLGFTFGLAGITLVLCTLGALVLGKLTRNTVTR